MSENSYQMEVRLHTSLLEISPSAWQKLTQGTSFPFHDYEYLMALESSGSVGAKTGWQPVYLTVWHDERMKAASFVYVKSDSYGEYIFDWAWANAFHQTGHSYYPKLTTAIPFTPATGSKFLLHPEIRSANDPEAETHREILLETQLSLLAKTQASSYHALFIPEEDLSAFEKQALFIRHSYQYHWHNQNYRSFDDFLANLVRKRRKEVKRERESLKQMTNLRIQRFENEDLTELVAKQMYDFYLSTIDKRGAIPYLQEGFFKEVFKTMRDRIVVFFAYDMNNPHRPIAGTLNFYKGENLFGRYWGCHEEVRNLHFELCYYQTIDFAIEKGLKLFEAGAQGEHKFSRGFTPALTYSAHKILNEKLAVAIQDFVSREKRQIKLMFEDYREHWPYQSPT